MTLPEIIRLLREEALEHRQDEAGNERLLGKQYNMNSFGAGYNTGAWSALEEMANELEKMESEANAKAESGSTK